MAIQKIETLINSNGYIKNLIQEWKMKSIEEQRAYSDKLKETITLIDSLSKDIVVSYLGARNILVFIRQSLEADLPYTFLPDEEVIIKGKRTIKGIVVKHCEQDMKSLLVKPIDNVFKSEMIVAESSLEKVKGGVAI